MHSEAGVSGLQARFWRSESQDARMSPCHGKRRSAPVRVSKVEFLRCINATGMWHVQKALLLLQVRNMLAGCPNASPLSLHLGPRTV